MQQEIWEETSDYRSWNEGLRLAEALGKDGGCLALRLSGSAGLSSFVEQPRNRRRQRLVRLHAEVVVTQLSAAVD